MPKPPYRRALEDLEHWWESLPDNTRTWVWIIIAWVIVLCFLIDALTH